MTDIVAKAIRDMQRAGLGLQDLSEILGSFYQVSELKKICELACNFSFDNNYPDLKDNFLRGTASRFCRELNKNNKFYGNMHLFSMTFRNELRQEIDKYCDSGAISERLLIFIKEQLMHFHQFIEVCKGDFYVCFDRSIRPNSLEPWKCDITLFFRSAK